MKTKLLFLAWMIVILLPSLILNAQTKLNTTSLSWSFMWGTGLLVSPENVGNKSTYNSNSGNAGVFMTYGIPLSKEKTFPVSGFSLNPGLMVGSQSFGINKLLEDYNGNLTVSDIQGDYDYSFIREYYSDIMLNMRYITKANAKRTSYGFEIGPSIGWLSYTEKGISRTNGNNTILDKTKHAGIFNHNRYGVNGIVYRRTVKVPVRMMLWDFP